MKARPPKRPRKQPPRGAAQHADPGSDAAAGQAAASGKDLAAGAEGAAGTLPFGDDLIDALTEQMGELNEEQAEQVALIVQREKGDLEGKELNDTHAEFELDLNDLKPATLWELKEYVDGLATGSPADQEMMPASLEPLDDSHELAGDASDGGTSDDSSNAGSVLSGDDSSDEEGAAAVASSVELPTPLVRQDSDTAEAARENGGEGAQGAAAASPSPSAVGASPLDGETAAWAAREAERHSSQQQSKGKEKQPDEIAKKAPPRAVPKAKTSLMKNLLRNIGGTGGAGAPAEPAEFKPAFEMAPAMTWQGVLTVGGTRYSGKAHALLPPQGEESSEVWEIKRRGHTMLPPNFICSDSRTQDLPTRWTESGQFAVPLEDVALVLFPASLQDTPAFNGLLRHLQGTKRPLRVMLNSDVQLLVLPNAGLPNNGQELYRGNYLWAAIMPNEIKDEGSLVPKGSRSPSHAASIDRASVRSILKQGSLRRRGSAADGKACEAAAMLAEAARQASSAVMRASSMERESDEGAGGGDAAAADGGSGGAAAAAEGKGGTGPAAPQGAAQSDGLPAAAAAPPAPSAFGLNPAERASMVGAAPLKGSRFILPGFDVSQPEVAAIIKAAEAAGAVYQSRLDPDDHDRVHIVLLSIDFLRRLPENRWFDLARLQRRREVVFAKSLDYLNLCVRTGLRLDPTPLAMALFPQGGFVVVDRRMLTASPRAAARVLEALAAASASSAAREGLRMAALMKVHVADEDTTLGERRSSGERWVMKLSQQDVDLLRRTAAGVAQNDGANAVAVNARATLDAFNVHRRRVLMITPEEESRSKSTNPPQIVRNALKIATFMAENFRFAVLVTNDAELSKVASGHRSLLRTSLDDLPALLRRLDEGTGSLGYEFDYLEGEDGGRQAPEAGADGGDAVETTPTKAVADGAIAAAAAAAATGGSDSGTSAGGSAPRRVTFSSDIVDHESENRGAARSPLKERWISEEDAVKEAEAPTADLGNLG